MVFVQVFEHRLEMGERDGPIPARLKREALAADAVSCNQTTVVRRAVFGVNYFCRSYCLTLDGRVCSPQNPPHLQGEDDDDEDICHGKIGDHGTCTVGQGQTASVNCADQAFMKYCIAFANCGPGQDPGCGGEGWDAFGGIDHNDGKAFYVCKQGTTTTSFKCP